MKTANSVEIQTISESCEDKILCDEGFFYIHHLHGFFIEPIETPNLKWRTEKFIEKDVDHSFALSKLTPEEQEEANQLSKTSNVIEEIVIFPIHSKSARFFPSAKAKTKLVELDNITKDEMQLTNIYKEFY